MNLIERKKETITELNLADHLCDLTYQIIPLHLLHLQIESQMNVIHKKRENTYQIIFHLECHCQINLLQRKRKVNKLPKIFMDENSAINYYITGLTKFFGIRVHFLYC